MSKYKKQGTITVSPTLMDRDGTKHDLHKKKEALVEPCSWNDLRDKPFYKTTELVEIVPEQSVTGTGPYGGWYGTGIVSNVLLELDKEYIIIINGIKKKIASIYEDDGIRINDNDFIISNDSGTEVVENQLAVGWTEEFSGETITLAIYKEQEVVKTIDSKFMPEGYPRVETETVEIVPEQSVTADRTINSGTKYTQQIGTDLPINNGAKGKIVVNGKEYSASCVEYNGEYEHGKDFYNEADESVWASGVEEKGEFIWHLTWSVELGETITLAIYKEQEFVKQLDPKFIGKVEKTRFYFTSSRGGYLYHDNSYQTKVTKDDFLNVDIDDVILVFGGSECKPLYVRDESGEFVIGVAVDGEIAECYTEEYEEEVS